MLVINKSVSLDTFDLLPWNDQNRSYFSPAIWDGEVAPSGYYQSGIGYGADCQFLGVNVKWEPQIKTGHYFIRNNRFYLYSYNDANTYSSVIRYSDGTVVGDMFLVRSLFENSEGSYHGQVPAFVGNFKRYKDQLVPNNTYQQTRLFSGLDIAEATGYVDVVDITGYAPTKDNLEFMLDRMDGYDMTTVVTGENEGVYYETPVTKEVVQYLALNDWSSITGTVTDTFTISGKEVFCKLSTIPIAQINSVKVLYGGVEYTSSAVDITSGFIPGSYRVNNDPPAVLQYFNSSSGSAAGLDDVLYPSGYIEVTYTPGLYFVFDNSNTHQCSLAPSIGPLNVGASKYNLLLTNTEVDPVSVALLGRQKRCLIAGFPVRFQARARFNEAPMLGYPIHILAGMTQVAQNNLTLSKELYVYADGDGYAEFFYVPPKAVDDEGFKFKLGHYIPVVDVGDFVPYSSGGLHTSGITHGVGYVGTVESTYTNSVFFPSPKYAKPFLSSKLFAIYDLDPIRNNDWIGFLGALRIKGEKQIVVSPARIAGTTADTGSYRPLVRAYEEEQFQADYQYKFRTSIVGDLTLKFCPFSTETSKLMTYCNGRLVGVFNTPVAINSYHTEDIEYSLDYEYILGEKHGWGTTDKVFLNRSIVTGLAQGDITIASGVSASPFQLGVDYSLNAAGYVNRLEGGSIPASGYVYINYLCKGNYVYDDCVNTLRFITTDYTKSISSWDVVDVQVSDIDALYRVDNRFVPALPIGFFTIDEGVLNPIPLDQITDDTMISGLIYYNLPHSINRNSGIIGYYLFTKGRDFVRASMTTSYGKSLFSNVISLEIDTPDYMSGFLFNATNGFTLASPYSTIRFMQDSYE